jgi:protein-S-isoprenylcysteine O-methyltransferase Ste14
MLSAIVALILIVFFFYIESSLRYGEEAKSLATTERDKKSTSYIFKVFGINIIILLAAIILNYFNICILFHNHHIALIGNVIMIMGLSFRITAVRTLREYYTRTLKTIANHKIIDSGLYKYIRHPGYLGLILFWTGAGISSNNYISATIIFVDTLAVYYYRIKSEEKMLVDAFGEDYINYKKRTWRLLPPVY